MLIYVHIGQGNIPRNFALANLLSSLIVISLLGKEDDLGLRDLACLPAPARVAVSANHCLQHYYRQKVLKRFPLVSIGTLPTRKYKRILCSTEVFQTKLWKVVELSLETNINVFPRDKPTLLNT